jgi:translation elongation factor EF-G
VDLKDGQTVAYVFQNDARGPRRQPVVFPGLQRRCGVRHRTDQRQSRGESERMGQLYRVNGSTREPVPSLHAGDIGAVVKLRATRSGDTLCSAAAR